MSRASEPVWLAQTLLWVVALCFIAGACLAVHFLIGEFT